MDSKYSINNRKNFSNHQGNKPPTEVKFNDAKRPRLGFGHVGPGILLQQKRNLPIHGVRNR